MVKGLSSGHTELLSVEPAEIEVTNSVQQKKVFPFPVPSGNRLQRALTSWHPNFFIKTTLFSYIEELKCKTEIYQSQ